MALRIARRGAGDLMVAAAAEVVELAKAARRLRERSGSN
jgi:hypothetical protein